jgi:hypothetical protein
VSDDTRTVGGLRAALARHFVVDVRALAALRMALGGLLLVDLLARSRYLVFFYTDTGVFPRAALRATRPVVSALSVHRCGAGRPHRPRCSSSRASPRSRS